MITTKQACKYIKEIIGYMDIKKNEDLLVNLIKRLNDNGYYVAK